MAVGKTSNKTMEEDPKKDNTPKKVPPDGGWGWFVVTAFALNFATVIPIMQNFGLLFGDEFRALKFSDTAVSVLINVNYSVGVGVGLFNGPILRTFSFRKVAAFGSVITFVGMVLTSFAVSFWQFLVYYSILLAVGTGLSMAAFSFAVNSYFKKRRGMAMGYAMTATGLGPIIIPHVIGLGVSEYGAKGTALLLAGLSLHSLMGAMLLQPVEWHMKPAPDDKEKEEELEEFHHHRISVVPEKVEEQEEMLPKTANGHPKDEHRSSTASVRSRSGSVNREDSEPNRLRAYPWWNSGTSLDTVDLANTLRVATDEECHRVMDADDDNVNTKDREDSIPENPTLMKPDPNPAAPEPEPEKKSKTGCVRGCLQGVVRFFDLDLLRDPIYVNLMLGMSLAVFAEVNFSLLMPFILRERNLTTNETATMLSLIATADIVFRFLAPFIGRLLKYPSRVMYALSLCLLVASRTTFVFSYSYATMLPVMIFLGMAKGIRTVFWVLVIPDYVPLERLPAASGIQSITNGLISLALGPVLGIIKDILGSYNPIILVINAITVLTVVMWTVEMCIRRVRRKNRLRKEPSRPS